MSWFVFTGTAVVTTLRLSVLAGDTTIPLVSTAGWPTPTGGKLAIGTLGDPSKGEAEEKIHYASISGNDLTGVIRGRDGTAPQAWGANTLARHTISAEIAQAISDHLNNSALDDHPQYLNATRHAGITHTQGMLGTDSVGAAQIIADSVGQPELGPGSVGTPELIDASVTPVKLDAGVRALFTPTGIILPFAGTAAPSGFLLCDGAAVSRAGFADLFAVCGTAFGIGDGSSTFNVPDLRGRFPLGTSTAGTGSTRGGVGGTIDHVHALDSATSHAKIFPAAGAGNSSMRRKTVASFNRTHQWDTSAFTGDSAAQTLGTELGGNSDVANPPFQSVSYIVKT
jgi:microcystin-dependent protein